jgi:hypothetical protein
MHQRGSVEAAIGSVVAPAPGALASLFYPEDPAGFFESAWQRRPHWITGRSVEHYANLLSVSDLETLLAIPNAGAASQLTLIKADGDDTSTRLPPPTRSGILDLGAIYDAYAEGYTVVLRNVGHRWPPIARLCNALEETVGHPVEVSLYLTPAGALPPPGPRDTRDVFLLQVAGALTWQIHTLNRSSTQVDTMPPTAGGESGNVGAEGRLQAGDLLYLPGGYVAQASASAAASAYLAVRVNAVRWYDLLRAAVTAEAERDVHLREGLPVGFLNGSQGPDGLKDRFAESWRLVTAGSDAARAVRRVGDSLLDTYHPPLAAHFASLSALDTISLDTPILRRTGLVRVLVRPDSVAIIQWPGRQMSGPAFIEPALRFIAATPRFVVRELPDCLTENSKPVLTRRLVKDGLLAVDTALAEAVGEHRGG